MGSRNSIRTTSTRCCVKVPGEAERVRRRAEDASINFNIFDADTISIALNETLDSAGLRDIVGVFATALGKRPRVIDCEAAAARTPSCVARQVAIRAAAHEHVPDASGVQHAPFRDGDDALHPQPRAKGPRARQLDDPARVVHDEAERGNRDAPDHVESVQPHASVRAGRTDRGLRARVQGARGGALRDHRLREGLTAAELRRARRVHRADGDSRVSPRSRRAGTQRRADSGLGSRHQPGQRGHGGHARCRGPQQGRRQRGRRRPAGEGRRAPRPIWPA